MRFQAASLLVSALFVAGCGGAEVVVTEPERAGSPMSADDLSVLKGEMRAIWEVECVESAGGDITVEFGSRSDFENYSWIAGPPEAFSLSDEAGSAPTGPSHSAVLEIDPALVTTFEGPTLEAKATFRAAYFTGAELVAPGPEVVEVFASVNKEKIRTAFLFNAEGALMEWVPWACPWTQSFRQPFLDLMARSIEEGRFASERDVILSEIAQPDLAIQADEMLQQQASGPEPVPWVDLDPLRRSLFGAPPDEMAKYDSALVILTVPEGWFAGGDDCSPSVLGGSCQTICVRVLLGWAGCIPLDGSAGETYLPLLLQADDQVEFWLGDPAGNFDAMQGPVAVLTDQIAPDAEIRVAPAPDVTLESLLGAAATGERVTDFFVTQQLVVPNRS
ncbi:MAG: hypothetical protein GY926_18545 [bacterium]|nr:hypothetical protein [bacterium]